MNEILRKVVVTGMNVQLDLSLFKVSEGVSELGLRADLQKPLRIILNLRKAKAACMIPRYSLDIPRWRVLSAARSVIVHAGDKDAVIFSVYSSPALY